MRWLQERIPSAQLQWLCSTPFPSPVASPGATDGDICPEANGVRELCAPSQATMAKELLAVHALTRSSDFRQICGIWPDKEREEK